MSSALHSLHSLHSLHQPPPKTVKAQSLSPEVSHFIRKQERRREVSRGNMLPFKRSLLLPIGQMSSLLCHFQRRPFAGHSHWQNIKHRKGRNDAAKSMVGAKFAREIRAAIKIGGRNNDPKTNFHLEAVLRRAQKASVAKSIIEKALGSNKGHPRKHGKEEKLEQITYEAIGAQESMFMIDVLTENKNRTLQELKKILTKHGCHLASANSVAFQFEQLGCIRLSLRDKQGEKGTLKESIEEKLLEAAMNVGAVDVDVQSHPVERNESDYGSKEAESVLEIYTEASDLKAASDALHEFIDTATEQGETPDGLEVSLDEQRIIRRAKTTVEIEQESQVAREDWVFSLMTQLDDHPDIIYVATNVRSRQ